MLFFLLLLLPLVYVLIYSISKVAKDEATQTNSTTSYVEPKPPKNSYLDLNNLDNVDDFSDLVYKYLTESIDTYGRTISTRQVINSFHSNLQDIVRHLNKDSNFSFIKHYDSQAYSHRRKPTDVFFKNDAESVSHYRYHVLDELIPLVFLKEDSLKIAGIKSYFINKESGLYYLWDKLTVSCESDNGFNDRYSSASIYCALAVVLAIRHVIQNRLKEDVTELLDDHLTSLEIELDIAKPPKVCDKTLYCPTNGIEVNSHTISKILNIFKRD